MQRIRKYCSNSKKFKGSKITVVQSGYNCDTYLLKKGEYSYIAQVGKKTKDSGSSLYNAYRVLKFFEYRKMDFVPRVVGFSKRFDTLIQTYVGKKDAKPHTLDSSFIDLYMK